MTTATATEDHAGEESDKRLFGLADAVFAIAMTLLALDLQVPDLGGHPSDSTLTHALAGQGPRYLVTRDPPAHSAQGAHGTHLAADC